MENLVALVTGADRGDRQTDHVPVGRCGRDRVRRLPRRRGQCVVEEIGGDARLLVVDVTDAASIDAAARQVGALDILVDNAGVSGDGKTADREDLSTFQCIYETNAFGVVAVTNAFVPGPRRSEHPRGS